MSAHLSAWLTFAMVTTSGTCDRCLHVNMGTFTYSPPPPPPPQFIIVSSLLKVPQLTLFDYKYPDWSITVGYLIGFSSFMWIPIYMVYKLVWTPGSLKQV